MVQQKYYTQSTPTMPSQDESVKSLITASKNTIRYGWLGDTLCSETKNNRERTIVYQPNTFVPLLSIEHDEMEVPIEIRQCRRQFEEANLELPMDLVFKPENLQIAFYHTDHLGTPLKLTSSTGEELWSAEADDWKAVKI